jgi:hypothetical protein
MGQMKILWESLSPYREGLKSLSTGALEAMLGMETDAFRKQLIEVELERRARLMAEAFIAWREKHATRLPYQSNMAE